MELQVVQQDNRVQRTIEQVSNNLSVPDSKKESNPFIEANTKSVSLSHLRKDCTVPVFSKDNEITISHNQFIETSMKAAMDALGVSLSTPEIRISHQIKGRTPDAIHIPANELLEHQRTIYYERMAWIAKIPSITETIGGNELSLTIGGVRAYNHENLYSKKSHEKFKFFIGFQNMVCCNLCVSTDGYQKELKTDNVNDLYTKALHSIQGYNTDKHLETMLQLEEQSLTDSQFAKLIGRAKLYQYLPKEEKAKLPELLLTDSHFSTIAKDYYDDKSFCRNEAGDISLWKIYNLFTGANKSSYIDTFLDRSENAFLLANGILNSQKGNNNYDWFLK